MERSGWAYGDRGEWDGELSRYLTILGSAHRTPELYATQDEAERALEVSGKANIPALPGIPQIRLVVAHVTEVDHPGVSFGYAYRITQPQNA